MALCYIRRLQRHSPIAQLVEQLTVNQLVTGSSPVRGAIFPSTTRSFLLSAHTCVSVITVPSTRRYKVQTRGTRNIRSILLFRTHRVPPCAKAHKLRFDRLRARGAAPRGRGETSPALSMRVSPGTSTRPAGLLSGGRPRKPGCSDRPNKVMGSVKPGPVRTPRSVKRGWGPV